jgi:co-chaperonin GroES (HSP10)
MILTPELENVGKSIRVLRDRVLVKVLPYTHALLETPGIEINKGVVIAVGYGRRQRRKTPFKQMEGNLGRTLWFEDGEETGAIIPMQVKPGDVVEFSFRNFTIVDFDRVLPELNIGALLMIWEKAIYSIDPDESLQDCLMWQQSAGHDRHGNFMSGQDWHKA